MAATRQKQIETGQAAFQSEQTKEDQKTQIQQYSQEKHVIV